MTLLFCEGFDKYGPTGSSAFVTANLVGQWTSGSGTVADPLSTYGYACSVSNTQSLASTTFTSVSRIAGSCWCNTSVATALGSFLLRNGATAAFTISFSQSLGVRLHTGNGGAVIGSGGAIVAGTSFVLSFDVTIGASAAYNVYLDGSLIISGSTGNTGNGQASVNTIALGDSTAGATIYDNLALFDPTQPGYVSSVLTLQAVVETQFPTGDNQTQFTNDGDLVVANAAVTGGVITGGTTNAPGANQLFLVRVTAGASRTINSVSVLPNVTSAPAKFKAVIYSDVAGAPDSRLSDGVEVVGATAGATLTSALVTPQALVAGTSYWIGFYTDTSVTLRSYLGAASQGQKIANTYASGAPAGPLVGVTTGQITWLIWGNCTGSAVNWVAVGRNPAINNSTSQTHSNTIGQEDLFTFPALQTTPSVVYGAAVKGFMSKSDSGTRTVSLNMKSGASDATGSSASQALSTTKQWQQSFFETDPATGVAWTASGINNAASGYSVAT